MRRFVVFEDRTRGTVRRAAPEDVDALLSLYDAVYGGTYTLPEATDRTAMAAKMADPGTHWTVCVYRKEIVGSLIFSIDRGDRLAKAYAAAVHPAMQGRSIMHHMAGESLALLCDGEAAPVDCVYATTRTVSFAPQKVLETLGFRSLGVFPNVRKVARHETHGLSAFFTGRALALRRPRPAIRYEIRQFYETVRAMFGFEEARIVRDGDPGAEEAGRPEGEGGSFVRIGRTGVGATDAGVEEPMRFLVERDGAAVRRIWRDHAEKRLLRLSYYPFHAPDIRFHCPEAGCEVFLHLNPADGHGAIVGVKGGTGNLEAIFSSLEEPARALGAEYLELLVSAFDPATQKRALDARFLPCAYFPAMKRAYDSAERLDVICFSRSFVNLDFTGLHLVEDNRRFLEAFMGCWYAMRLRHGPSFEEMMAEEEFY